MLVLPAASLLAGLTRHCIKPSKLTANVAFALVVCMHACMYRPRTASTSQGLRTGVASAPVVCVHAYVVAGIKALGKYMACLTAFLDTF